MFNFFKKKKRAADIFTETIHSFRKYTSIDLSKLTIDEQGFIMELMEDWLVKTEDNLFRLTGRKLTEDELIIFGWTSVINSGGISGFEKGHSLYGKKEEILKGLADFVIPIWNDISPYFHSQCSLNEIKDKKSRSGKDISHLLN